MNTIKKIALSFIIILLSLLGLSKLYDFAIRQNVNVKAAYIQKSKIDAELLIHGPCEPLWMISPKQLDLVTGIKSYNLALSHSDFADNYLHLYFYLKNNKAPRYLFLYVTPESMDPQYNTFNTYRFAPFTNDTLVDAVLKECDSGYYKWMNIPFMKYSYYNGKVNFDALQGLKHWVSGKEFPLHADGFEPPMQVVWDNHLEEFNKLYPEGYRFKWDNLREKYLRKTITLAQQHNIKVYLYESPVLEEAVVSQPNRVEMLNKIKAVALKHNVKFVQFDGMEIAKSRAYFMSTLNTNAKGSRIFTDSLGKYIKNEIESPNE